MVKKDNRRDPDERRNLKDVPSSALVGPKRQCTATSKATGERCKRYVSPGMRTCRVHGSATRKTKVAAAKRIAQASGYAAEMLVEFMADPATPLKDRVQIAQDLLNRAGVAGKSAEQNERFELYQNIVLASTVPLNGPKPDDWDDDGLDGPWEAFSGQVAAPAQNVIDAEVVEDHERARDEQTEAVERERDKRRRRGVDPELPPAIEQRVRPRAAPAPQSAATPSAPSIEDDPRDRQPVPSRDEALVKGREQFLLDREGLRKKTRPRRRA